LTNQESKVPTTLVLGVGNLLMADEGVGLRVIERMVIEYNIPEEVLVLDGGTLGMDLLYYLEGKTNLLLLDAVEARKKPGSTVRLEGEQVPSFLSIKISPHQIGISDMLFAAKLKDVYPPNIVLWGIQPEKVEIGLELSKTLEGKIDSLVDNVIHELESWGHKVVRKV
jgi:hydrogenase maturation protease